jgi:hypothetical protein
MDSLHFVPDGPRRAGGHSGTSREWVMRCHERPLQKSSIVIPAEAGIQVFKQFLDPGFRRGDEI